MFGRRALTVAVAALLVGAGAAVFATQVQGEAFERQGAIDQRTAAYHVDWQDDEPGLLRLALDETGDAVEPRAELSLFAPNGDHLGTYQLDSEFPTLDHRIDESGEHTLVVHQAVGASVDVLSEEDRSVELERTELVTETIDLLDGEHADVARQLALDRATRDAHIGLAFEGVAQGLEIEVLNGDDEVVLSAVVESADTDAGDVIVPDIEPDRLQTGNMLVRLKASSFNGTLDLELGQVETTQNDNVLRLQRTDDGNDDEAEDDDNTSDDDAGDSNASEEQTTHDEHPDGTAVATLEPAEPVAFTVPEGVDSVLVIAREGCGIATLYGPDDSVLSSVAISDENGQTWNESEHTVAIELPVSGPGEHVVLLSDTHDDGTLFVPGIEDASAVDTRALEIAETSVTFESDQNGSLISSEREQTQQLAVPEGVIGFDWHTEDGVDVDRRIRLIDPGNETVYEANAFASTEHANFLTAWEDNGAIVGPTGTWTIETSSDSLMGASMEANIVHYVR